MQQTNAISKSKFVRHLPCENCGSSDANSLYEDGSAYCFACSTYVKHVDAEGDVVHRRAPKKEGKEAPPSAWRVIGEHIDLPARGLTKDTCKRFEYACGVYKGAAVQIADYYRGNQLCAQKLRFADKTFAAIGDTKNMPLFGSQLCPPSGKMLIITEGEIDCLTVSQVLQHKWPVVSLPSGAQSAKAAISESIEMLLQFDKIVLCFDMDAAGKAAAQTAAQLLPPGKAFITFLPQKDASMCLQMGAKEALIDAIWKAQPWRPDGILSDEDMRKALDFKPSKGYRLPWDELTDITFGARKGELWTLLAGSGVGKSEFMKEICYHMLTSEQQKVGVVFLEETPTHTLHCILGKHLNKVVHLSEDISKKELLAAFDQTCSNGRLLIYDHKGVSEWATIKSRIRFMAHHGATVVILDHLTAIAYGKSADTNELIHGVMEELNALAQELSIVLFMISHIRKSSSGQRSAEEGGRVSLDDAYGSAAIKQRSNFVFSLERNQHAEQEGDRHVSTLRCLKDRYTGQGVGKSILLAYDIDTGRLQTVSQALETSAKRLF